VNVQRGTPVPAVDAEESKRRIDAGALLLDVREDDEWSAGHAAGAMWIPLREVQMRRDELSVDKEILVVCRSGARSAKVTAALLAWGHDAVNISGGLQAWVAAGLPIVTDDATAGEVI
jgi:rhodanese-related sulfurtransferase